MKKGLRASPEKEKKFRLEVGKKYLRRDGKKTEKLVMNHFPYKDPMSELTYTQDGRWSLYNRPHPYDIVAEYKPKAPKTKRGSK